MGGSIQVVILLSSLVLLTWRQACATNTTMVTQSTMLNDIFENYDKRLQPNFAKNGPERQVQISVNIYISKMFSLSEANMEYSMSFFLRRRWLDKRLAFENTRNLTRLELHPSMFDNVWGPDMYILNEKKAGFHQITTFNKLIHIYPDGTVQDSMRVTGSFSCEMYLQKYPFDSQTCFLKLESYGHSTENMKFVWSADAVTVSKDQAFPQFTLIDFRTYSCEQSYYGIVYPCIGVDFNLERNYGYYLIQIYVPSILIVILSFVNFWLDPHSVPARISLGLLTVLTMTTQSSGARANLPAVSYVKAIDVWMAANLAFVFLGLVEYSLVNVLLRAEKKKKLGAETTSQEPGRVDSKPEQNGKTKNPPPLEMPQIQVELSDTCIPCFKNLAHVDRARMVDKISRWLFPIAFAVFNLVYWLFYFL